MAIIATQSFGESVLEEGNFPVVASVTAANAASNTADVAIVVTDNSGDAITEPVLLHVWLSDLTTGIGGSAHTHSTGPAVTVGEEITELISNDAWLVLTTAAGAATLRLIDTAAENVTVNACVLGTNARVADTTVTADFTG